MKKKKQRHGKGLSQKKNGILNTLEQIIKGCKIV